MIKLIFNCSLQVAVASGLRNIFLIGRWWFMPAILVFHKAGIRRKVV
jgi:hypothetical protein